MKYHRDLQQGTEEWLKIRQMKMTASNATAIGNNGKGLETYITELMAEYHSSAPKDHFSTKDTDRGNELEPIAREMYELEKGVSVEQVGFIEESEYVGCSPDGLVEKDGGTEIKCLNDMKHYQIIRDNKPDSSHIWQCQMNMLITKRKWWDLIYYNPNFKKSLVIFRIESDKEKHKALREGLKKGAEMIKSQLEI